MLSALEKTCLAPQGGEGDAGVPRISRNDGSLRGTGVVGGMPSCLVEETEEVSREPGQTGRQAGLCAMSRTFNPGSHRGEL